VPDSVPLGPWANIGLAEPDDEVAALWEWEQRLEWPPSSAQITRELISRLQICHFKFPRHVGKIIEAIGAMRSPVDPDQIGRTHPRYGPQASQADAAGRSSEAERFIAALEIWLAGHPPRTSVGEVITAALGDRSHLKEQLVSALSRQLRRQHRAGDLGPELGSWDYQIRCTHQCHHTFPQNVHRILEAIGRGEPVEEFEGCGTFDAEHLAVACQTIQDLEAWLSHGAGPLGPELGPSVPAKVWLSRCLRYTLIGQTTPVLGRRRNAPIVASLRRVGEAEALPPYAALQIRPLSVGDELGILSFYHGLSQDTLYLFQPYARMDVVQMAEAVRLHRTGRQRHWVVVDERRGIVGHAFLCDLEERMPRLWLGLADDYQGLGLGRELLAHLLRHVRDVLARQGVCLSVVASNVRALRLCQEVGFVRVGERSWQRSAPFPQGMVTSLVEAELEFAADGTGEQGIARRVQ